MASKEMQKPYKEFVGIHIYAGNWYGFLYHRDGIWSRFPIGPSGRSGDRASATVTHADTARRSPTGDGG